jgi:hypothetical protein
MNLNCVFVKVSTVKKSIVLIFILIIQKIGVPVLVEMLITMLFCTLLREGALLPVTLSPAEQVPNSSRVPVWERLKSIKLDRDQFLRRAQSVETSLIDGNHKVFG